MYALFALVLIACIAAGIAIANTIGTKDTSSNAELEQQVTQLQQQVSNLQNQLNNTQDTSPEPTTPTTTSTPSSPSLPPLTTPTSTNAQQPVIPGSVQTFKHAGLFIDFPSQWHLVNLMTGGFDGEKPPREFRITNEYNAVLGKLYCPRPELGGAMGEPTQSDAHSIINGGASYVVSKALIPPTAGANNNWINYLTVYPKIPSGDGYGYNSCVIEITTQQPPATSLMTQINAIYNSIR